MNVVLIGFMGAGKTTIAPQLAFHLGRKSIEMDSLILEISGRKTICDIFDTDGEATYRHLEAEVAHTISKNSDQVISTGGGIICNETAISNFKKNTIFVYLRCDFRIIQDRLQNDTTRPLFRDEKKASILYENREPIYRRYADFIVETKNRKLNELSEAIALLVKDRLVQEK